MTKLNSSLSYEVAIGELLLHKRLKMSRCRVHPVLTTDRRATLEQSFLILLHPYR